MLIGRRNFHRHLPWLVFVLAATIGAIAWYVIAASDSVRRPGGSSTVGIVLGIAAGAIFVFEFLLWPRKRLGRRSRRFGRMHHWMRAHLWLGILTVPLVVLHSGVRFGGFFTTVFMLVYIAVIVSGLFGWLMQIVIPRLLLEHVPAETVYSEIDHVSAEVVRDADRLIQQVTGRPLDVDREAPVETQREDDAGYVVVGALRENSLFRGTVVHTETAPELVRNADELRVLYRDNVRPYLLFGKDADERARKGSGSTSPLARRESSAEWFGQLRARIDPKAESSIRQLEAWCEQRRQFDMQARLHGWLHGWLAIHLPLSAALMILLVWHVIVALKYW